MLTVEEHFVIKDLYRRGVSISEIARRTGHDRKTIRQRLTTPLLAERAPRAPRAPRASKIDSYVPYLEQRLAEGVLNAHKLFGEIVARGYPGGESQVKAFVQYRRPVRPPQATVRFETALTVAVGPGVLGGRSRLFAFCLPCSVHAVVRGECPDWPVLARASLRSRMN